MLAQFSANRHFFVGVLIATRAERSNRAV